MVSLLQLGQMSTHTIFTQPSYLFPYQYKFPGQASDEKILFVTRENPVMLTVRRAGVLAAALFVMVSGWWLGGLLGSVLQATAIGSLVRLAGVGLGAVFVLVGWWWVTLLWQKSVCIVTTKRLTKFIYTTPVNRHNLSLPLEMIVDTGSYTKGFVQALFKLGTFTARSAAAASGVASEEETSGSGRRINRKYFYIENVAHAEDLQHYITKLLSAFRTRPQDLANFRPFIPHLKGDERKQFMEQYPEYWS